MMVVWDCRGTGSCWRQEDCFCWESHEVGDEANLYPVWLRIKNSPMPGNLSRGSVVSDFAVMMMVWDCRGTGSCWWQEDCFCWGAKGCCLAKRRCWVNWGCDCFSRILVIGHCCLKKIRWKRVGLTGRCCWGVGPWGEVCELHKILFMLIMVVTVLLSANITSKNKKIINWVEQWSNVV